MPAITINIAAKGTARINDTASSAGHMWFELDDGLGHSDSSQSFGWGPNKSSPVPTSGGLITNDSAIYQDKSYSRTITISQEQYNSIKAFATDPAAHGFNSTGRFMSDSCIDYVWAALYAGGLNPKRYQGHVWPIAHAERITGIPDVATDEQWRQAGADVLVNELLQHSQILSTEFWKARLLSDVSKNASAAWHQQSRNVDVARTPLRHDPLVLDLDGDGIETAELQQDILFDHNNDGIKTGTGWVKPDDGLLVLDRNVNDRIDNGNELFGDNTRLADGRIAANGFQALADQDSNHDGIINAEDANWHQLRVWRDINQDGVSQHDELFTLAQVHIASLTVASSSHLQTLSNGNQIADQGHFTNVDGTSRNMVDVNFSGSRFFRQFSNSIAISAAAAELPDIPGTGLVRDLRQAASVSPELLRLLSAYSQATTRPAQRALLDALLSAWAATVGMAATMEQRTNGEYTIAYQAFGNQTPYIVDAAGATVVNPDWSDVVDGWQKKLRVLEAFNGNYFFDLLNPSPTNLLSMSGLSWDHEVAGLPQLNVNFSQDQIDLLNQSYAILHQSMYAALIVQTRFKTVLDKIEMAFDANGMRADYAQVEQYFNDAIRQNAVDGLADLIEFNRYVGPLAGAGWNGIKLLESHIRSLAVTPELQSLYNELGVTVIAQQVDANQYSGSAGNDIVVAGDAADCILGQGGDDVIFGGAGDDSLFGGAGDDVLDGGGGNDILNGGTGNDTYLFGIGSGQDVILARDETAGKFDVIQLGAGITTSDIIIRRFGYTLWLSINGRVDCLGVAGYFYLETNFGYQIEQIRFADGTIWDVETVKQLVTIGTEGRDAIYGSPVADTLNGLGGNDRIEGKGGNDIIDGGSGDDVLYGGEGDDTLFGGSEKDELFGGAGVDVLQGQDGNDQLLGGPGDDVLDGGAGVDTLNGGPGNEILIGGTGNDRFTTGTGANIMAFNRGDGQDLVYVSSGKDNTLSLGHGITYVDLLFSKKADDLTLTTGTDDKITFKNWYRNAKNHGVAMLQMVIEDGTDYDATSASAINNKKITQFNFAGLVSAFDQARAESATLKYWALSSSMSDHYLGGSDTGAIGGDLAYQYARKGSLSTISLTSMRAILTDAQFGRANQQLLSASALQDASPSLA